MLPPRGYDTECFSEDGGLLETPLSILLTTRSPEVGLLGYMVVVFLIFFFLRNSHTVYIVVAPFYIPIRNAQVSRFLHILANILFFNSGHPNGCEVTLIVVVICLF